MLERFPRLGKFFPADRPRIPLNSELHPGYELTGAQSAPYENLRITILKIFRSLRKFFEPGPSLPLRHSGESRKGIQVGWWCGRRVRHNFLPARRRRGWIPASAGMTENERAFQVWLRLCRARSFVVSRLRQSSVDTRQWLGLD
jgi:hypothetical protein